MSEFIKVYKYKDNFYSAEDPIRNIPIDCLCRKLNYEGKIITILDYWPSDCLTRYYYLQEDYQRGLVDYETEDFTEFLDKFADRLGIEILEVEKCSRKRRQKNETRMY